MSVEQEFLEKWVEFHPCLSEECYQLQQMIENEATSADDTLDLATAFLIMRDIQANTSLQDISDPVVLTLLFLDSLNEPYSRYLSSGYLTQNWEILNLQEASMVIVKLLNQGAMGEPSVFDNIEQALKFTQRLFQCFGEPCYFLTNVKWHRNLPMESEPPYPVISKATGFSVFKVGCCWDEGVVLISSTRVGALWFLGYD
ncbi:MAG: hypothetical protein KME32_28425 [Mojavia pulchra JT2-VF2]|jgi:hypothetical protein|uniref:Uncharacterized protein n=1 Tax=Mojavia pulchra JT2-VF2 TaxID=287848 RepID=A0A951UK28_9NOST|nr:hypothetical protein [Mojavia pulchra JT2-VF2]